MTNFNRWDRQRSKIAWHKAIAWSLFGRNNCVSFCYICYVTTLQGNTDVTTLQGNTDVLCPQVYSARRARVRRLPGCADQCLVAKRMFSSWDEYCTPPSNMRSCTQGWTSSTSPALVSGWCSTSSTSCRSFHLRCGAVRDRRFRRRRSSVSLGTAVQCA